MSPIVSSPLRPGLSVLPTVVVAGMRTSRISVVFVVPTPAPTATASAIPAPAAPAPTSAAARGMSSREAIGLV
jgi:hypothetical protein